MSIFFTPNKHGYSIRFSPFDLDRLVCATSENYGLTGNGTLFSLILTSSGKLEQESLFQWQDSLFDVTWSETSPNIVVTGSGDGILQVWNLSQQIPAVILKEHAKEVYSVDWSQTRQENLILSASWDGFIKVWDPCRTHSVTTHSGHAQLVYSALWSPLIPSCFASVSGDGSLRIWSTVEGNTLTVAAHNSDVLSCAWSRYDPNVLATAGSDGIIRGWDLRYITLPIFELIGCEYAVRRIQFSPHRASAMASVSYDLTTRIWDYQRCLEPLETILHHSEFVYGLDFSNHKEGLIADCGWDSLIHVFSPESLVSQGS